jgi:hypothetical protein
MALLKKQDKQPLLTPQQQQQQQYKPTPRTNTVQLRSTPHHLNVPTQVRKKKLSK